MPRFAVLENQTQGFRYPGQALYQERSSLLIILI